MRCSGLRHYCLGNGDVAIAAKWDMGLREERRRRAGAWGDQNVAGVVVVGAVVAGGGGGALVGGLTSVVRASCSNRCTRSGRLSAIGSRSGSNGLPERSSVRMRVSAGLKRKLKGPEGG